MVWDRLIHRPSERRDQREGASPVKKTIEKPVFRPRDRFRGSSLRSSTCCDVTDGFAYSRARNSLGDTFSPFSLRCWFVVRRRRRRRDARDYVLFCLSSNTCQTGGAAPARLDRLDSQDDRQKTAKKKLMRDLDHGDISKIRPRWSATSGCDFLSMPSAPFNSRCLERFLLKSYETLNSCVCFKKKRKQLANWFIFRFILNIRGQFSTLFW